MRINFFLTSLFLTFSVIVFSQQESLNQLDSGGNKHGRWILYLDKTGAKLKDSVGAVYCRYTFFDHGVHVYPMGHLISKNGKLVEPLTNSDQTNKIKLLDGEYKCLDKKGRVVFIHVFKKGEYISYTEFYPNGQVHTFFDYTKQEEGQEHSWYFSEYQKKGKLKYEGYVKKDKSGQWPRMSG